VHVKHPDKFWEAYKDLTRIWDLKDTIDPFTPAYAFNSANMLLELFNENGWVHAYNAQKSSFQPMMNDVEYLDRYIQRPQACFCCPFPACGRRFKMEDSKYGTITGDEREVGFAAACIDAGISSWPVALKFRDLCNRAGADEHQMLYTITWAMECYEKGIINKKDTDGVDLRFGNAEAFLTITERIIAREGFGDVLANGAYKAAEIVGKGSDRYALTIKGKELEGMPQRNGYQMALALAVCEGGPDHTRWYPPYPPNPKALPKLTTVPFDLEKSFQTRSVEDKGRLVKWLYVRSAIIESLPTCVYLVRGILGIDLSPWLNIYNACTGADCGLQEFTAIGERIVNLERSYIVREGFRRKDDTLPRRMMEEPIAEINIPPVGGNLDLMLDDYYTQMGWDVKTAIPKADTLSKLGLDFVAEDFKNRGISVG
jgi:aldehyde:ferredoxin oxidoreductase